MILRSFRIFAGFELQSMHRSDKGPKIVPPLFGFRSPFGHPGFRNSLLEGRASPHLGWLLYQIDPRQQKEDTERKINKIDITLGTPAGAGDGGRSPPQFRIQDSGFRTSGLQGFQDSGLQDLMQDSIRVQFSQKYKIAETQPDTF